MDKYLLFRAVITLAKSLTKLAEKHGISVEANYELTNTPVNRIFRTDGLILILANYRLDALATPWGLFRVWKSDQQLSLDCLKEAVASCNMVKFYGINDHKDGTSTGPYYEIPRIGNVKLPKFHLIEMPKESPGITEEWQSLCVRFDQERLERALAKPGSKPRIRPYDRLPGYRRIEYRDLRPGADLRMVDQQVIDKYPHIDFTTSECPTKPWWVTPFLGFESCAVSLDIISKPALLSANRILNQDTEELVFVTPMSDDEKRYLDAQ